MKLSDISRTDLTNTDRRAVDKTNIKSKPTTVSEHFLSHSNHSHTDMQLITHSIDKAMTLEPHGLNLREELL